MRFKVVKQIVTNIIESIQNTAIASVNALKANTFKTKVSNFPKNQRIKGTVTVGNQKKVEKQVKETNKKIDAVLEAIKSIKAPEKIRVTNLKEIPEVKIPEYPKKVEVSNQIEIPPYPKALRVKNQPIKELQALATKLNELKSAVSGIKLDPKINVQAPRPERLIVPPANVSVTQREIDYKKLAKVISALIPDEMNYEKLAEVLAKEMGQMVITGPSGGGGKSFTTSGGKSTRALIEEDGTVADSDPTYKYKAADIDMANPDVWYYGFVDRDGAWYITEDDKLVNSFRFIKGDNSYIENWAGRDSLSYGYFYEVF